MKITWLGQAGLLLETCAGKKILVDPYLSDSVEKVQKQNARRVPVDSRFLAIQPDILCFTHDHLDHFDPETAPVYLEREPRMTVLSPFSVYRKAREYGHGHNYVLFDRGTEWTEWGVRFRATPAVHSEEYAIGLLVRELSTGESYYITGDTLYSEELFRDLPQNIRAVFLPINGVGNNMNPEDARRFAEKVGAKYAVPIHFGMFDGMTGGEFTAENRIIPEIYREIVWEDEHES